MPYLLLQSVTDLLVLMLCNVHISSHPLNKLQEQITLLKGENSDFIFWMERAWSPLCCHGNVRVEISWNFVVSATTVQSFSSIQKKSSDIFHFLWVYIILCPCDVTSHLICVNQNLEKHGNQNCYHNKINAILHHFESSSKWANKKICVIPPLSKSIFNVSIFIKVANSYWFYI